MSKKDPSILKRLLGEPFVQFSILAIAIFVWFYAQSPEDSDPIASVPENTIVIGPSDIAKAALRIEQTWSRKPTVAELQTALEAMLREEVLVREAYKLSMDQGDPVVRQRLAQKMAFIADSIAQSVTPDDDVLRDYFNENVDVYTRDATVSFEQVFLGNTSTPEDIEAARDALLTGAAAESVGAPTLLPGSVESGTNAAVNGMFGPGFFEAVSGSETGEWQGPFTSGYGVHLVRITQFSPPTPYEFEDLRDQVLGDWRRTAGADLAEDYYSGLLDRYVVTRPTTADLERALTQ